MDRFLREGREDGEVHFFERLGVIIDFSLGYPDHVEFKIHLFYHIGLTLMEHDRTGMGLAICLSAVHGLKKPPVTHNPERFAGQTIEPYSFSCPPAPGIDPPPCCLPEEVMRFQLRKKHREHFGKKG